MDFDNYIENERIKNDSQEQEANIYCDRCDCGIFEGENYYKYENLNLCEDCMDATLKSEKKECERIAGEEE